MGSLFSRFQRLPEFPDYLAEAQFYRYRWVCWSRNPSRDIVCSPGLTLFASNVKYDDFQSCYESAVRTYPQGPIEYPDSQGYHLVTDSRPNCEIPFGNGYKFYFVIMPIVFPRKPASCLPYPEEVGCVYRKPFHPNLKTYPSREECIKAAVNWWLNANIYISDNYKAQLIIDK